jgi:hypothetical protein
MKRSLGGLALLLVFLACALPGRAAEPVTSLPRDNGVAILAGIFSSDVFSDIVLSPWDTRTESIYLLSGSYNRRLTTVLNHLDIEVEAGVGRRFGDNNSAEAYAALGLRWREFPWNDYLRTSFAVYPIGPSYVANLSASEVSKDKDGRSSNWLNFFSIELTFAAPSMPQLEAIFRLHHRSGVFGLINGSTNGADFLSVGARYRF